MSRVSKFLKSSGIYLVGSILAKAVSFFMLPLYTNRISTAGMGWYDVSNAYLNIIVPIVCVSIWSAILRFSLERDSEEEKYAVIGSAMTFFAFSAALFAAGAAVLGHFTEIADLPLITLLGLALMLQNCYSNIARALGCDAVFSLSGVIGALVNCAANLVLILCFDLQEQSLFIALTLGLLSQSAVMEAKVHFLRRISFRRPDFALIGRMLRFSFPLAVNSVCFWFLSGYDKVAVSKLLGLEASGIYAVAAKYTYVIGLISGCFSMAMQETLFSMKNSEEEKAEFYSAASNYIMKSLMYGLLLMMPFVYFSFPLLIGKEYAAAFRLIPLYLLATAANFYSNYLGDIFSTEKKTAVVFFSTVAAAAVNMAVFHLLVGRCGVQAANIGLTAGFLVDISVRLRILRRWKPISVDFRMLLFTGALFGASCYVCLERGDAENLVWALGIIALTLFEFRDLLKKAAARIRAPIP